MAIFILDPTDWDGMREIMDTHGNSEFPFYGENENGEQVVFSVFPDRIVAETAQRNGWIRKNIYYRDGTAEELYEPSEGKLEQCDSNGKISMDLLR